MATSSPSAEHVVLVGMMGAGKTTVGTALATRLERPFFDVDSWIEDEEGLSVAELFKTRGEAAFRGLEATVLGSFLDNPTSSVLSVGGGAVVDPGTREALTHHCVIWLRAANATLVERVGSGSGRPLLAGKDVAREVESLLTRRQPIYEEVADVIVDVDGVRPDEIVDRIVTAIEPA